MVLQALEFSDCLLDSPHFRERLNAHEKELDNTNKVIKRLIQEGKDLINAAKHYAKCQRTFAQTLMDFKFETIGSQQTDEEILISKSLKNFGEIISNIEDARDTMMERIKETFVDKLEDFRRHHIVSAKDERKRFEKTTKQFCTATEKHLSLKPAKSADGQIQESDTSIESERKLFQREAMVYVMKLQEVQERKKFEFVEILLAFMYGWTTFYHQGHETGEEMKPYMTDLGIMLNKTRDNFESYREEAAQLMHKMLDRPVEEGSSTASKMFTRQGYLYAMEKKALGTIGWNKYFCSYQKEAKIFTMIPFHQTSSNAGKLNLTPDTMVLSSCTRKATDAIDRRFCFDITIEDRANGMTLQALSDVDRQQWLLAMDGKEPVYSQPVISRDSTEYSLNEVGFTFVRKCIDGVETRGLTDQGLYRVVGVSSKVNKLMQIGLDPKRIDKLNLSESGCEFEVKTITSALKNYFRKLSEPLMTYRLHQRLIAAAKLENKEKRVLEIGDIICQLPTDNHQLAKLIIAHLKNVAAESARNMMGVSNLSVCFGPTLLRPEEETVAAIMDIKFCNLVVEILIENCDTIFSKGPSSTNGLPSDVAALRTQANKTGSKGYSEDSTYGKHRPSYRASSVYANVSPTNNTATSPTRPDRPDRPSSKPLNNITITLDKRLLTDPAPTSEPKVGPAKNRPDLYASVTPPVSRGVGRATPNSAVAKKADFFNNPNFSTPSKNNYHNPSSLSESNPTIRNNMSKSYGASSVGVTPAAPPPSNNNSLHLSHGPKSLSKLLRGVTRSSSRSKPKYLKSSVPGPGAPMINRRVRTLYACEAENDSELSFEPNVIIYNVKESQEPGWLEGTYEGKTGLIPANYIEYVN